MTNLDHVSDRERIIFDKLLCPGVDRYSMPEIPEKSEPLRKAEKCSLYPHISIKENEVTKLLIIFF